MNRRSFTKNSLKSVVSYALLSSICSPTLLARSVQPVIKHWAIELQSYCLDLKKEVISPVEWQQKTEALFSHISLDELLSFIQFEQLIKEFEYPELGVNTKYIKFPKLSDLPERTAFVKKIFGMKKDRAIIPHGHSNMASAHLVLKGSMHLRHYEKIKEESQALIIKPSIDKIASVGDYSSISDEKDNIHWFIAESETAFTFDAIMLDLNEQSYDIHNLDIYNQRKMGDGLLHVPKLDLETALKKYGKHSHH